MTRSELFAVVWSAPMVEVSKSLGISDTALAEVCKRENLPRPYRGFWRQLTTGNAPSVPSLPQPELDSIVVLPVSTSPKNPSNATKSSEGTKAHGRRDASTNTATASNVLRTASLPLVDGAAEYKQLVDCIESNRLIERVLTEIERRAAHEPEQLQTIIQKWLRVVRSVHASASPAEQVMLRLKTSAINQTF